MPSSKIRSGKRSSSTSYASTITTAVFIALCILGVWMLTSSSVGSRRSNGANTRIDSEFSSFNEHRHITKTEEKKDAPIYEDNPGDLPDDAIKSEEHGTINSEQKLTTSTETAVEVEGGNDTHESEQENGGESLNVEERTKAVSAVEESHEIEGKESEKLTESETQVLEETAISQDQKAEELDQKISDPEENQQNENQEAKQSDVLEQNSMSEGGENQEIVQSEVQEQNSVSEIGENSQQTREQNANAEGQQQQQQQHDEQQPNPEQSENEISDEDQQQRIQQQKEQQQEQQNPGSTKSDDTPQEQKPSEIENPETTSVDQELQSVKEEAVPQIENQEIQREINPETITEDNNKASNSNSGESLSDTKSSGIPKESKESKNSWATQAAQSENQKERQSDGQESSYGYTWELCNVTAGTDYIPCLDNEEAIRQLHGRKHFEHRERHCPVEAPTCLVPLPNGYKRPVEWPGSRDKIWYHNVPHMLLAEVKGHQNWVKLTGEFLTFPGGGTQFIHGALHYIQFLQEAVPSIAWGKHTRVVLDVGCGVASFGGFLFEKDVLAMSFAPKDEHEAQVQFALERGIPAISAVMGSQRLQFPSRVFDLVHCARCRVPWHAEGGTLLLELNRVLRPGGYFVWSATPVYQKLKEDVEIWEAMSALTISMCWELVTIKRDKLNSIGAAIYHKPMSNDCYDKRKIKSPPMCKTDDDPNAAWYVSLQTCMHQVPVDDVERGSQWPEEWPRRLVTSPYWLNSSQIGIYGKPAPRDFEADYEHWKRMVDNLYMKGLGISWSNVRNIMDMRAVYGGFAAALKDLKVWVMNVVNIDSPDTLPIIYERGLFGIYHDWCESFSTYPRTYDLVHADHLFSRLKKRCKLVPVMAEVDRIVRPGGKFIVRDESKTIGEIENLLKSLQWEVHLTFSKDQEGILSAQKSFWRPESYATSS